MLGFDSIKMKIVKPILLDGPQRKLINYIPNFQFLRKFGKVTHQIQLARLMSIHPNIVDQVKNLIITECEL